MLVRPLFALKRRFVLGLTTGLAITLSAAPALAQAPGGFVEKADSTAIRPRWTASEMQAFLPERGKFAFPAPYDTAGIRITNPTDCAGSNCVSSLGMNNHRGSETMLIFVGLRGVGPTLFSVNKVTERVRALGPLFDPSSPYAESSGEGWYFSATRPTSLYVTDASSPVLQRYDVLAKTFDTVFDATQFGDGRAIGQPHSSADDNVHSAILRDTTSGARLGCLVYREDAGQFLYYPAKGNFDQCQIDKSGRWLVITDDVDGIAGYDSRIIDLETGAERVLLGQKGGGGRFDTGYGYMIAEDRWNGLPGAFRVWSFDESPLQGTVVYHDAYFGTAGVGPITHSNAQPGVALSQQYACAGRATSLSANRSNEIVCFHLDESRDVLVVTQVMTDLNAAGGGDRTGKQPTGMLDVTGAYFLWTSNMGGRRSDAFLVKIPAQRLTRTDSDALPAASAPEPAREPTSTGGAALVAGPTAAAVTATLPNPALLPVATIAQVPLTAAYNLLNVPSRAAGSFYLDPSTGAKIYKLTSATFPVPSANWGHDYSEGGDEVSLPYNGDTRAALVRQDGGSWWLVDFTPGAGVGNPRQLTGNLTPLMDLAFTFSNNPATPYYAYVSSGATIRRFDIRTMVEAPGNGWPVTGETSAMWLHQSENDGMFVWMRGANGSTIVGYEPSTATRKTYTNANLNEPRIDRAGRYVALSMGTPLNALVVWDFQTSTVVWSTPGDPGIPFAHNASLRRRWMTVDWNMSYPPDFAMFTSDVPNSGVHIPGPANGTTIHGNGSWIQHPADLNDQWALFCHYGSLRPAESYWLAPGGMVLITPNGQRRLLGHPYNTTSDYTFFTFAKFSSDGKYVLFTSDMNGSGRSDVFLAEVPGASSSDSTPPTVSITAPAAGPVSGALTVSANAADDVGVAGVQFKLDGGALGAEDTSAPFGASWNTALIVNGSHTLTAVARDAAGNSTVSAAVVVTVNNVVSGPVISLVTSSSITTSGATITWTTSSPSDTQVEYGPSSAYGSSTTLNTSLVVSHAQMLSGLAPGILYHYRVKSRDGAGSQTVSGDFTFTTLADPNQGMIAYLKFNEGSGTTIADASGRGNAGSLMNGAGWSAGVSGQAAVLDGVDDHVRIPHAAALDAFPLSVTVWFRTSATTGVSALVNKYVAGSYDGYQLFVTSGDLCAWYLRDATNYVYDGGACPLRASGYNDGRWHQAAFVVDSSGGRLYVDAVAKGSLPWTGQSGPPTTVQDVHLGHYPGAFGGLEYLAGAVDELRIYDRALSASDVLQVYSDSRPVGDVIPPVVSLTAPLAGQTLTGSIVVSASASDDVGVVGLQLKLDGSSLGPELSGPPYSVSWNTTGTANGSHSLSAVARDAAGNSTASTLVTVTVGNNPAPVISSVSVSGVSSSGATVAWTTNVPADSQVEYGSTGAYGSSTVVNASLVVSHAQTLSGLTPGALYHYRVKSRSGAGTLALSGDFTFTTMGGTDPSLLALLRFDEGAGTAAADASGRGNAGTLTNGASWTAGRSGQAVALDGVDDYVRIPHTATLNAFPLSASIWFKTSSTKGVRGLLNKYVGGSYNGYQLFLNNGRVCAWYLRDTANYVYDGGVCMLSKTGFNDGRWHQAVFVVDAAGGRLYVDGVQRGSRAWTGLPGPPTAATDVHLGHYPGAAGTTPYLPGAIDEFRIYNRALSASEILQLYNGQP